MFSKYFLILIIVILTSAVANSWCGTTDNLNGQIIYEPEDKIYFEILKIYENFYKFREFHGDWTNDNVTDDNLIGVKCYAQATRRNKAKVEDELKSNQNLTIANIPKDHNARKEYLRKLKAKEIVYKMCTKKPRDRETVPPFDEGFKITEKTINSLTKTISDRYSDDLNCFKYQIKIFDAESKLLDNFDHSFKYFKGSNNDNNDNFCEIRIDNFLDFEIYPRIKRQLEQLNEWDIKDCMWNTIREYEIIFTIKLAIFKLETFTDEIKLAEYGRMNEALKEKLQKTLDCLVPKKFW